MERLSPLDASFLHIEDDVNHMHIGSVGIFEGPSPGRQEIVDLVSGKLHLVPRYRQVVRFVPFDLGRPVWVDDRHFAVDYHVRHTALPGAGSEEELRNLVGRVMSQQLDRHRPLWEVWVVDRVHEGDWALLSKTHHCMVDGIAGTDLLAVILDASPEPVRPHAEIWRPRAVSSSGRLVMDALADRVISPAETLRSLRAATRGPRQAVGWMRDVAQGIASMSGVVRPAAASSLNGPIGPHRRWSWARSSLAEVKAIRSALGGTVNDVVLAAITRGFRDLLLSRGEPADRVVRTLVPVSVRAPGERGTYNNRVSAIIAELPVGIADDGRLTFGVTGDYDTAADVGVLCAGIEDAMAELRKLAAE